MLDRLGTLPSAATAATCAAAWRLRRRASAASAVRRQPREPLLPEPVEDRRARSDDGHRERRRTSSRGRRRPARARRRTAATRSAGRARQRAGRPPRPPRAGPSRAPASPPRGRWRHGGPDRTAGSRPASPTAVPNELCHSRSIAGRAGSRRFGAPRAQFVEQVEHAGDVVVVDVADHGRVDPAAGPGDGLESRSQDRLVGPGRAAVDEDPARPAVRPGLDHQAVPERRLERHETQPRTRITHRRLPGWARSRPPPRPARRHSSPAPRAVTRSAAMS